MVDLVAERTVELVAVLVVTRWGSATGGCTAEEQYAGWDAAANHMDICIRVAVIMVAHVAPRLLKPKHIKKVEKKL